MPPSAPESSSLRIGIVTVSDRASRGEYEDQGGPAVREYLAALVTSHFDTISRIIPDDRPMLEQSLIELCDRDRCSLVLTTGGTGPSPRDITPEATISVCEKLLPGFGEQMRRVSVDKVPTAILSRQTAGIRGRSLIINLPGRPKAIAECLEAVIAAVPDCLDQLGGPSLELNPARMQAFRHKN